MKEFPLLIFDDVKTAISFKLKLNDKFPDVEFIVIKYGANIIKYAIFNLDDVSDEYYMQIYQYAQRIFTGSQ